jgi:hypothetical protein
MFSVNNLAGDHHGLVDTFTNFKHKISSKVDKLLKDRELRGTGTSTNFNQTNEII